MALEKYRLVNLPERGIISFETSKGTLRLDEELTDEDVEVLLKSNDDNVEYYIQEV